MDDIEPNYQKMQEELGKPVPPPDADTRGEVPAPPPSDLKPEPGQPASAPAIAENADIVTPQPPAPEV